MPATPARNGAKVRMIGTKRPMMIVTPRRSPVTGKWVKARYVAELQEIRDHYAEFELIGEPEVRETNVLWTGFNPFREPDKR
jgi:hypothetical protein